MNVRHHCAYCGFVTTTSTLLALHHRVCKPENGHRLETLKAKYEKHKQWFQNGIDSNATPTISDLRDNYNQLIKSMSALFIVMMKDFDGDEQKQFKALKYKYEDEAADKYAILYARCIDKKHRLATVEAFLSNKIPTLPQYMNDDNMSVVSPSLSETSESSFSSQAKVIFDTVPTMVPVAAAPMTSPRDRIKASRRSVGQYSRHL